MKTPPVHPHIKSRRRVALLIESSRAYGRGLFRGIAKFVREHHEWSVQSEEWKWTDGLPAWLRNWDGDGVIGRVETPEMAKLLQQLQVPVVDVRGSVAGLDFPLIDTEDRLVARLAAEHLMNRGFREFAFCGFVGANYSDTRSHWYRERLKEAGYTCHVYSPPQRLRDGQTIEYEKRGLLFQEDLGRWLQSLPKPVGVMACNDIRGQQVLNLCGRLDIVVPETVAVIGADNDEVLCELSDPPLSSVVPDTLRIGYEAAALLDRLMAGGKVPSKPVLIPPLEVVSRRSTDVLALDDPHLAAGLRFIREHAFDPITINEVARAAGMSRRVFERRFVAQMGRPPKAEVLRLRLERVKQLLADTDWSLAEIAEKTGFKYGEYLHSVFTQKVRITPGKFRRQADLASRGRFRFL
ncbi:MAG TPA: DNA-binding transcriptional regulator [Verrucomicrobiae bacterium]|jgi:LacI family transcriptional regulator|nr:DNA-binding transcriptional regulator [Verrucomicrobiae bacterium]